MSTTSTAAAPAAATTAATASSGASTGALGSLSSNFNDFLKLLMTQLQNQDPTSPMDTNQFTSQLVQFTSVEQQINTNTSLTKLIQATQGSNLIQASSLVGQTVSVSGNQVSLQDGQAQMRFTATEPVSVGIYNAAGAKLRDAQVAAGQTGWTWDGKDNAGRSLPAGAYTASVQTADGTSVPFEALGTVTGVQRKDDAMTVQLGGLSVSLDAVQTVAGGS